MRIVLLLALTGCLAGRAQAGAHTTTAGVHGVDASGAVGMGWSWTGHQGVYVTGGGGVTFDGHARGLVVDRVDYVNQASVPFSLGAHGGVRFARRSLRLPAQVYGGGGFAIFPFHNQPKPAVHEDHSDDSWATAPLFPDLDFDLWGNLGFELDADVVEGEGEGGVLTASVVLAGHTMRPR